ncbi:MAG: hypothetical protein HND52_20160 [Ignavibacteriae bacterium]|nr:hypothetical protein [Ignavibacteriota bacterium]NOH00285.1 hypothetical protein [Ignavibacteriota bacterium]
MLKGKVYDENKNPVSNLTIRFVSLGEITTTSSGEFEFEVPADISFTEIELKDKNWSIISPLDNRLPIPTDEKFTSKIFVVFSNNNEDEAANSLLVKIEAIEKLLKEIDSSDLKANQLLEKLTEKFSENYNFSKEDFLKAVASKQMREKLYSGISINLSGYILALKDVKSIFNDYQTLALEDEAALNELIKYVNKYNDLFVELNNKKFDNYNGIETHWNNPAYAEEYLQLVNYAIDEIHKPYILRLNETIVNMNKINRGIVSDEDEVEELKEQIKSELKSIIKDLEVRLPILDKRIEAILLKLKDKVRGVI